MIQVQTTPGNVVLAFRPPAGRAAKAAETPQETGRETRRETATVLLFTGTRYERRPDAGPAAPDAPGRPELESAHS